MEDEEKQLSEVIRKMQLKSKTFEKNLHKVGLVNYDHSDAHKKLAENKLHEQLPSSIMKTFSISSRNVISPARTMMSTSTRYASNSPLKYKKIREIIDFSNLIAKPVNGKLRCLRPKR